MMRKNRNTGQLETVTVEVHGQLLDRVSFHSAKEADSYKRGVRQWAREKGIIVGIWSQRAQQILPTATPVPAACAVSA